MKIKTQDLTGIQLDWAVAKCLNWKDYNEDGVPYIELDSSHMSRRFGPYKPSTNWEQAGSIIEQVKITISPNDDKNSMKQKLWVAYRIVTLFEDGFDHEYQYGPTPLIAAMRCFVASRIGDEVDIPEESMK